MTSENATVSKRHAPDAAAHTRHKQHAPGTIMLSQAQLGKTYRVLGVEGGSDVKMRLAGMGVMPGQIIKILKEGRVGPAMILLQDAKLALGRGVSNKLLLTPAANTQ